MPRRQKTKDFFINSGSSCYTEPFISLLCGVALKIVDLSKSSSHSDDPYIRHLSIYVQEMISQGYNDRDYIFSQFISSYCQSLGYDGIGYRSKYATRAQANKRQGVNITFFNYDGCAPVESKLYQITRIATGIQPIGIVET